MEFDYEGNLIKKLTKESMMRSKISSTNSEKNYSGETYEVELNNFRQSRQTPLTSINNFEEKTTQDYQYLRGSGSNVFKKNADESVLTSSQTFLDSLDFSNRTNNFNDEYKNLQQKTEQLTTSDLLVVRELTNNSYSYYGETEFSDRNGFGICFFFANNSKYVGQWKSNKQHGFGKLTNEYCSVFEGEFKNGKPDGFIQVTTSDGGVFQGIMKNFAFIINSPLIITTKIQIIEILPEKEVNMYNSKNNNNNNTKTEARKDTEIYLEGIGCITNVDKSIYTGFISDFHQDRLGIFNKDNIIYKGNKKNRMYNGFCEICYKDGTKYFGLFKNNKKEGIGFFLSKDLLLNAAIYKDNFKNGASFTRKFDQAINNEVFVYENWHHGFRSNKMENKIEIENYLKNFYPEQLSLVNLNFEKLVQLLKD